jgi:hypothetical protein
MGEVEEIKMYFFNRTSKDALVVQSVVWGSGAVTGEVKEIKMYFLNRTSKDELVVQSVA